MVVVAWMVAVGLAAQTAPPPVHPVGDRWSAWDAPAETPPGAQVHIIQRGDTLWDLASRFLGTPYLWPQIWEQNPYILDAHWIYPGDPLVVGLEVVTLEELSAMEAGAGEEEAAEEGWVADAGAGPPVPLGSENDIYCGGYLGAMDEQFDFRIAGSEYESLGPGSQSAAPRDSDYGRIGAAKLGLTNGDVVYLDRGREAGLSPGDLFTVVETQQPVRDPDDNELLGRHYHYLGQVRVLSVQDESAIAEISRSCYPIEVGDSLRPFEARPVPLARRSGPRGVNEPVSDSTLDSGPVIVHSLSGAVSIGQNDLVFVRPGQGGELVPGDVLTVYRRSPGLPPLPIGEAGVLAFDGRAALAKILESSYAIHVGDRLAVKSR